MLSIKTRFESHLRITRDIYQYGLRYEPISSSVSRKLICQRVLLEIMTQKDRERDRERDSWRERKTERDRVCMCVCVCGSERERERESNGKRPIRQIEPLSQYTNKDLAWLLSYRNNMAPVKFLLASFVLTAVVTVTKSSVVGTPINPWVKFACTPENIKVSFGAQTRSFSQSLLFAAEAFLIELNLLLEFSEL